MPDLRFRTLVLALGLVTACSTGLGPGYRPPAGEEGESCVAWCEADLKSCRGRVARAYQRCLQRFPADVLEQNRCFEQRSREVLAAMEVKIPSEDGRCQSRFDRCFAGCGGRVPDRAEKPREPSREGPDRGPR